MATLDDFKDAIADFANEWNAAERVVKKAELVDGVVIIPSILELRYAGRRFVDALDKIFTGGSQADIEALLRNAKFDCHRARHDAIDAATSKIAVDIEIMGRKLGYDAILKVHPGFIAFRNTLSEIQERIAEARGARQNREVIYASLEVNEYEDLVKEFKILRNAEPMIKSFARKQRLTNFASLGIGVIGIMIALTSCVVQVID